MATWVTLCENKDFRTLYYRGASRVHAGVVTYVRRNRLGYPRVGITTGKKVGCAVRRSRARRYPHVSHILQAYHCTLFLYHRDEPLLLKLS